MSIHSVKTLKVGDVFKRENSPYNTVFTINEITNFGVYLQIKSNNNQSLHHIHVRDNVEVIQRGLTL